MAARENVVAALKDPMELPSEFKEWMVKYVDLHLPTRQGQAGPTGAVGPTGADGAAGAAGSDGYGGELDYAERATDLTVTTTSAATAQSWIDGNAITCDGATRIKIEVWAPAVDTITSGAALLEAAVLLELYDGPTDLGVLGEAYYQASGGAFALSIYGATFLTPTAGSHTYHVKAWRYGADGTIYASSPYLPAWYRITVA